MKVRVGYRYRVWYCVGSRDGESRDREFRDAEVRDRAFRVEVRVEINVLIASWSCYQPFLEDLFV